MGYHGLVALLEDMKKQRRLKSVQIQTLPLIALRCKCLGVDENQLAIMAYEIWKEMLDGGCYFSLVLFPRNSVQSQQDAAVLREVQQI